ncbi:MAG TPA: hypothetical protein PK413_02730 [Thermoanaerobaculia bacterium]|nr:hypothetical protein [Thermoanaerobaculia bacterium]
MAEAEAGRSPELKKKLSWIALLYFAEGFPFGIVYEVLPVYFRVHGVDLKSVGLLALLRIPYTLKPTWAPLVDRFGARQHWVSAALVGMAAVILGLLLFDPSKASWGLWVLLLLFVALSATQDLAIDAYAVDVATPRDSGPINGTRAAAYRVALIASGGGLLILADKTPLGWPGSWAVTAGLLVLLAVAAFASPRVPRGVPAAGEFASDTVVEPPFSRRGLASFRLAAGLLTVLAVAVAADRGWPALWITLAVLPATALVLSLLNPATLRWAFRREMLPVVLFGLLYKVGDNSLGQMVKPFWVDRHYSPTEIGFVSVTLGSWLSALGAVAGGLYIKRRGIFRSLLWFGLGQLVSNLGYVAVAAFTLPRESIYVASLIESLTQGLGTAAFLSFLMNLCDKESAATQFAMLSATFSLSRDIAGALSGIGVETLGYTGFFLLTTLAAVPGLLLLPAIKKRIRDPEPQLAS